MDSTADSSSSAETIYSPLADSDEIRLLCLQPRTADGPIKCTLKHIKLSSKTRYEALSYMWGPRVFRTIEVDGKLCKVRINLWQALFRLRFENRSRILWIDALCINQADVNERNHQVTQMDKIYRNASTVVAWLGEPDSASSVAIKMLFEAGLGRASGAAYFILFRDYPINTLDAVHAIFLQEYWSRLWIVQEVTLAWEVILQWGTEIIAWDYLDSLVSHIDKAELADGLIPLPEPQPNVEHLKEGWSRSLKGSALAKLVRRRRSTKKMIRNKLGNFSYCLLHLCSDHGEAKCVDPRDKIFGLHALAQKCCTDAVPVDYSLSLFQISTAVLSHHGLSHNNPLELVSESRKFHDAIGLSPDHTSNETTKAPAAGLTLEKHYDQPLLSVCGNYSSHISFVNPMSQEETSLNPLPKLLYEIWDNLYRIGKQLKQSSTTCVQITAQLDLVFPTGVDIAFFTDCLRKKYDFPSPPTTAISPSNYLSSIDKSHSQTDHYHLYAFQQIVSATQKVVSPHSGLGIRLAFEENGAIILAPSPTMVGDILCRFGPADILSRLGSADTLAILRLSQDTKPKLIGRAVTLYPPSISKGRGLTDWPELEVDIPTLQMLTLASQHPDNTHTLPP